MEIGNELIKLIIAAVREARDQGKATGEGWLTALLSDKFNFTAAALSRSLSLTPNIGTR